MWQFLVLLPLKKQAVIPSERYYSSIGELKPDAVLMDITMSITVPPREKTASEIQQQDQIYSQTGVECTPFCGPAGAAAFAAEMRFASCKFSTLIL